MSSWTELMRSWLKTAPQRPGRPRRVCRLGLEHLELRDTPSITTGDSPTPWVSVGPVGINNSSGVSLGTPAQNAATGAVNATAIDPFNPNHAAIAAVNGGIWTTSNLTSGNPTWTPTTDAMPSLAISSIAFSPVVPNLVFAGTGSYSAGGLGPNFSAGTTNPGEGGPAVGVYRSADGGATWTQLGAAVFGGNRIRDVVPTRLNGGATIFVDTTDGTATTTGVYRSDDFGATWTRLSGANGLPALPVTNLIADPRNSNRFYAFARNPGAGTGAGVYMLDVTGGNATWVNITSNLPSVVTTTGGRVLLASTPVVTPTGENPVYAAVIDTTGGNIVGIFRAVPFPNGSGGTTYIWTAIGPTDPTTGNKLPPDVSPGQQPDVHFAIIADPTSDHLVYVAGDRTSGANTGAMARGDAIANTWTTVTLQPPGPTTPGTTTPLNPAPQPTTAPHPDFRGLVFLGTDIILASSDGGVYQVTNPRAANGTAPVWSSINGNLDITEEYQADVDNGGTASTADDVFMSAAQDNGESEGAAGQPWPEVQGGDGTVVRADEVNGYRYYSAQFFGLLRRDPGGALVFPVGAINGTPFTLFGSTPFNPVMELNQGDTNLMLVGGLGPTLFLSSDHADTFDSVGGLAGGLPASVPNVTSTPTAIAFGTTSIRYAAYVATDDGNISRSFDVSSGNGNFALTNFKTVAGGATAFSIAMDPNNPLIAYAVTNTGVFRTTDGANWVNITSNILGFVSGAGLTKLFSMALVTRGTVSTADDLLLIGGFGGVFSASASAAAGSITWTSLAPGLPKVVVSDLRYDALADTVIAGTYGRGVYVSHITPTVTVAGNGTANNIAVYPDPVTPGNFVVTDGLGNTQSFSLAAYRAVVVRGLGGADTITIGAPAAGTAGSTNPLAIQITVDGGGQAGDTLVIQDAADATGRQGTVTPTTIGAGSGDNLFGLGSVQYTGFGLGSVAVRLGTGSDTLLYNDAANPAPTTYTITAGRLTRSVGGVYDYSGADTLGVTGGSGGNLFDLQSMSGAVAVTGGVGADTLLTRGTAGNDSATLQLLTAAGAGAVGGLAQPVSFGGVESVNFDGLGGTNSVSVEDRTNTVLGSLTNLTGGMVYTPTGATSGAVSVGGVVRFGFSSVSSLSVNGDANGTGAKDTLTVVGTSAAGLQSAFGELATGDGRDSIAATDTGVSIQQLGGGQVLAVNLAYTPAGAPTFANLYVAGGNEAGANGDQFSITPSTRVNIVADGMGPTRAPGDRITLNAPGPFDITPATGPTRNTVTAADGTSVGELGFEKLDLPGLASGMVAVASDIGPETVVKVFDRLTGDIRFQFTPFPGFGGGATVATGDVNGDGIADVIVGAGPGGGPRVAAYSGSDGSLIYDFFGYEDTFRGGVNVAAADMDGDGIADLILGTGPGGGPRVRVLSGKDPSVIIKDFFAYESTFRGGVNVAAGDITGDGVPDLVTSTGDGGGPRVVVLDGTNYRQIASFFVFDQNARNGFYATVGDVDGDGRADIIAGNGAGGPAEVRVYSGATRGLISDFFVSDPFNPAGGPVNLVDAGVRVAAADLNGDGIDDIVTTQGPGSTPTLRGYQVVSVNPQTNAITRDLQEIRHQDVFDPGFNFGVFVGAGD